MLLTTACAAKGPANAVPVAPALAAEKAGAANPVCYECFWKYQEAAFRKELEEFYASRYRTQDPMVEADLRMLLGRVRGDRAQVCAGGEAFRGLEAKETDPERRLLAAETVAFAAGECGAEPGPAFERAAEAARGAGRAFEASVFEDVARGTFAPRFGTETIGRKLEAPAGTREVVLGESRIVVRPGTRVGVQIERTVRDWISYQMAWGFGTRAPAADAILAYHEGARVRDLLPAGAVVVPLGGVLAARKGGRWYAADETGTFRFEVLEDKIEYPTTRAYRDLALLVDTHGVSALVAPAVREKVDLVVACGDSPEKMAAAYHLARLGKDVYFPCDRFAGELLGHDASGTMLGSAPVRMEGANAIVGGRPVSIRTDEPIVVEDIVPEGVLRYYDAPARYFERLSRAVPLRVERTLVQGAGQSDRLVRRAREVGARVIAARVQTAEDAAPLRAWLAESPSNRAVLFHTAPYPDGYRLFEDFPSQTTFGDPHPRFRTGSDVTGVTVPNEKGGTAPVLH